MASVLNGTADSEYLNNAGTGNTVYGNGGNDSIYNSGANALLDGGTGNDSIRNFASNVEIFGGTDSDTIYNGTNGNNVTISGDTGSDEIDSRGSNVFIEGGTGDDSIYVEGFNVMVEGGTGNDSIRNFASNVEIFGDTGDDTIYNGTNGNNVTISGDTGSDDIDSRGYNVSISGGTGSDSIYIDGSNVTAHGGTGNDSIRIAGGTGHVVQFTNGGGSDTVYGLVDGDTVSLGANDTYVRTTSVYDTIIRLTSGDVLTLSGTANKTINIVGGKETVTGGINTYNSISSVAMSGTAYSDTLSNAGNNVTVYGNGGNDSIVNYGTAPSVTAYYVGRNALILAGDGDDTIDNSGAYSIIDGGNGNDVLANTSYGVNSTFTGGTGNDSIDNSASAQIYGGDGADTITNTNLGGNSTLNGNAGNDYITTYNADNVSIDGGADNDRIELRGSAKGVTVTGGAGNDSVSIAGGSNLINYNSGDGNDSIVGFNTTSTLRIGGGSGTYSAETVGNNNLILTVGTGKITLVGAATLSSVNIEGSKQNPKLITLTESADNYTNTATGVTIQALGGNDTIENNGSDVSIDGGAGDDSIASTGNYTTINANAGNDTILVEANNNVVNGGVGNDSIGVNSAVVGGTINGGTGVTRVNNWGKNFVINTEDEADYIYNSSTASGARIYTGAGNDTIENNGSDVSIDGGSGNDSIATDNSSKISISGGNGNDSIYCRSNNSTVDGGDGADTISNITYYTSVLGGSGADSIYNYSFYATINGGSGNDTISLYSAASDNVIQFTGGDGSDIVYGYTETTTINLGGATYMAETVGSNVVISLTSGDAVTLDGAVGKKLNITNGTLTVPVGKDIYNTDNNKTLTGSDYADTVYNSGQNVKISVYGGNDSVSLTYAANSTVWAGAGDDTINNFSNLVTVYGGQGADKIFGGYSNSKLYGEEDDDLISLTGAYWRNTIDGGSGNDTIFADSTEHSINGGAGADRISLSGSNLTISGGTENDLISLSGGNNLVQYSYGDGNDSIYGWNSNNTLTVTGATVTAKNSGNNVLINISGGNTITLFGAKGTTINVNGNELIIGKEEEKITPQDVIKNFMAALDKSNASNATDMLDYAVKTASNGKFSTLQKAIDAMVEDCQKATNGTEFLQNKCGIILDNDDTGAISGYDAGGTLKSAKSIVPESGTKFSLDTSEYGGYEVWYDGKNSGAIIRYTDVGNVTKDKQHIMDCAYTWWSSAAVKLINDSYGYNFSDSNAKYKKIYLTFSQSGDYLAYTGYYRDGLQININLEYFYSFKSNDYDGTSPAGQGYLDRTFAHETVHAIMFSKTENFHDMPQFFTEGIAELIHGIDDFRTGDINQLANDAGYLKTKLSMSAGTGDSPTYAAGYMLLRYLAKQGATVDNTNFASAITSTQKKLPTGVTIKDTTMIISTKFTGTSINMSDYAANLTKADASAYKKNINIFGNALDNTIIGGKGEDYLAGGAGNDTLSGGAGADIISGGTGNNSLNGGAGNDSLYSGTGTNTLEGGDGNDLFVYEGGKLTITDYVEGDKIKISSDKISKYTVESGNVVFTTANGSITLTGAAGKTVTIIDKDDKVTSKVYGKASGGEETSTTLVLTNSDKSPVTIGADVEIVDASARTKAIKIFGNDLDNTIIGGQKNDTLSGGGGNDLFVYTAGKDVIADYEIGDKISLGSYDNAAVKGDDVVFTIGKGSLTVKDAADKIITFDDGTTFGGGEETSTTLVLTNSDKSPVTIGADVEIVDASARTKAIKIFGNDLDNTIISGQKNDTLSGGGGNDLFVYTGGKDVITDYEAGDKISLGSYDNAAVKDDDVVFTIGKGSLTVKDAADKIITFDDGTTYGGGEETSTTLVLTNSDKSPVTIGADVEIVDASARTKAIKIFGNDLDNTIIGGQKNDTLSGELGDDELWGGEGKNTFRYFEGDGKDIIHGFGEDDLLEISGDWSAKFNKSKNTIAFKVGKTSNAITLTDFTATTFNVNGESYQISGSKLVK